MDLLTTRHLREFVPATPGCTIAGLDHVVVEGGHAAWAAGMAWALVVRRCR
jgi:hypothetical protein